MAAISLENSLVGSVAGNYASLWHGCMHNKAFL